jgi:hypothetical protein
MNTVLLRAVLLATLLNGCASTPPNVLATWYLQESGDDPIPSLYIVLLNRSAQDQTINGLVLNSPEGGVAKGWSQPNFSAATLQPGGLLVRKVNSFHRKKADGPGTERWPDKCLLPTEITVLFSGSGTTQVSPTGLLPSALPRGWENCP